MSTSVPPPGFVPQPSQPIQSPAPERERTLGQRAKISAAAAAVLAAAAVAWLLLGSGGGGGLSGPIAQAATVSASAAGYRMHMSLDMSSPSLGTPIEATGTAVVDLRDHAASMSMAMNFGEDPQVTEALGSSTIHMDMVLDGTMIYMKLPSAASAALPLGGKRWVAIDFGKLNGFPGLSSVESNPATSDPRQVLEFLRSASDSVVNLGSQRVDGFQTTHYRAAIDLDRLANVLPLSDRAADEQGLSALDQALPSHELPVDVWIDSSHLVRRLAMSLDMTLPNGSSMAENLTADLSDYGPQAQPTPPPANQVQDLTSLVSAG